MNQVPPTTHRHNVSLRSDQLTPLSSSRAPSGKQRTDPEIVLGEDRAAADEPALTMVGQDQSEEKQETPASGKKRSWMFWRHPSKRSQELAAVRKGCEQISEVVGAIRDQLHTAEEDREGLKKTLSPLPLAVAGLTKVGEAQEKTSEVLGRTNDVLGRMNESLGRGEEKDKVFFKSMDRLGDTMSNMDMTVVGMSKSFSSIERTSKQSVDTMDRLGDRLAESDRFLKNVFDRLRDAEREYSEHMRTGSRRSALVTITMCALLTLGIAVLAHTLGGASHNVTVLRTNVPVESAAPALTPMDWQAQPPEKWMGVAGDWPVDGDGTAPASEVTVGTSEQLEDLLSVNKIDDE